MNIQRIVFCILLITSSLKSSDIAVVTLTIGDKFQESVAKAIENKRAYCEHHGYDFILETKSLAPDRPPAWSKLRLLQRLFNEGKYRWLFWSDADALFMNFAIKLEEYTDEHFDMILSKDYSGLNTGQFLIKNCVWSQQLLQLLDNSYDGDKHRWDNKAFIFHYYKSPKIKERIKVLLPRQLNSCQSLHRPEPIQEKLGIKHLYQPGDFIIHFYALRYNKHIKNLIDHYIRLVIDHRKHHTLSYHYGMYGFPSEDRKIRLFSSRMSKQMEKALKQYEPINHIVQIGLQGGFISEWFLNQNPSARLDICDSFAYPYAEAGIEYFNKNFPNRCFCHCGLATLELEKLRRNQGHKKTNLLYFTAEKPRQLAYEIQAARALAAPNCHIWIDRYQDLRVVEEVEKLISSKVLELIAEHSYEPFHGKKSRWVELRFLNN